MKSLFCAVAFTVLTAAGAMVTGCSDDSTSTDLVDNGKQVSTLSISPDKATLSKGSQQQYSAVITYADGTTKDVTTDSDTAWNTSDADIATVSDDGMVQAVSDGAVEIKVTYKGVEADDHLAVTP